MHLQPGLIDLGTDLTSWRYDVAVLHENMKTLAASQVAL